MPCRLRTLMSLTPQGELDAFGTAGATEVTASIGPMPKGALLRMVRSATDSHAEDADSASRGSRAYSTAISKDILADVDSFVNDGTTRQSAWVRGYRDVLSDGLHGL
jgi:hypothetical protein